MSSTPSGSPVDPAAAAWPAAAEAARLHFVTGKGGTGKSTVAATLALALARGGRKVLLVEVEERQAIAQLFDLPPLPYVETKIAVADGGGTVHALAVDVEAAFLEYLDMFYNLGFAGKAMRRVGAVEFATTLAPGLRDVLLTGKVKEIATRTEKVGGADRPVYDAVVVDSPPTGRIGTFLDVTKAMADLAGGGPIRGQAEGVVELLHSPATVIHLVTLLEAMPVQETADAIAELRDLDLNVGAVIANRSEPAHLPTDTVAAAARGDVDAAALAAELARVGLTLSDAELAGLITETVEYAGRAVIQQDSTAELDGLDAARLVLPRLVDGVDLGGLYALAEHLTEQGVR